MSAHAKVARASVIPCLQYRDAPAAIKWLCRAFGFEEHLIVPGDSDDMIAHAELSFGHGIVMIGSISDNEFSHLMKHPGDIGGAETQCSYVVVPDCDAHYARAKTAGAKIVIDIKDEPYGGRGYSCRDLEGHLWNFGTYDPWSGH